MELQKFAVEEDLKPENVLSLLLFNIMDDV